MSTLFTLEIGRHVCMVREALASNFGCACFVRLHVRSGRSATYSCPHFGFPRLSQVKDFIYVYDPCIDNSESIIPYQEMDYQINNVVKIQLDMP